MNGVNTQTPIGGAVVKDPPASAREARQLGLIPESGRSPWSRKWQPTPIYLLQKFHGQSSLVGFSPRGQKELYATEGLAFSLSLTFLDKPGRKQLYKIAAENECLQIIPKDFYSLKYVTELIPSYIFKC